MTSAICSDSPVSRLSVSLESLANSSPFPSPSSSFLTPPTPGAHEFAIKPAPAARTGRKSSISPSLSNNSSSSPDHSPRSSIISTVGHKLGPTSLTESSRSPSQRSSYIAGSQQATSSAVTSDSKDGTHQAQVVINIANVPESLASSSTMENMNPDSDGGTDAQSSQTIISPSTPTPNNVPCQAANFLGLGSNMLDSPHSPAQFLSSSSTTPTTQTSSLPPENTLEKNDFDPIPLTIKEASSERSQVFVPPSGEITTSKDSPNATPSPSSPRPRLNLVNLGSRPLSTASTSSYTSAGSSGSAFDLSLFSTRPAPPSPGGSSPCLSRKLSTASARSIAGSKPVSRANSLRKQGATSANGTSSPTLAGRGDNVTSPHNRTSVGSQLSQSYSLPSLLASPNKVEFDMGISSSTPIVQDKVSSRDQSTTVLSGESSASPSTTSTSTSVSTSDVQIQPQQDEQKVYIKIRDFAFQPNDEKYQGLGPLVPKSNRVGRMNRRLGGRTYSDVSIASTISSSDGDGAEEEEDGDVWGWGVGGFGGKGMGSYGIWGNGFKLGTGRFSWTMNNGTGSATAATIFDQEKAYAAATENLTASSNGNRYPSRSELDRNFLDSSESEEYYDAEDDGIIEEEEGDYDGEVEEMEEEPLFPGLYRAVYAFEPEGTAEMRLVEDQIVRVVGRGGGVGWAIVVADQEVKEEGMDASIDKVLKAPKHALVPESYLEPYKLDWELEPAPTTLEISEQR